jgi:hypothetical protein
MLTNGCTTTAEPPIACGREIWGFPKKYAEAELRVEKDTLTGMEEELLPPSLSFVLGRSTRQATPWELTRICDD